MWLMGELRKCECGKLWEASWGDLEDAVCDKCMNKKLLNALNWALSYIPQEPYEWSCEEDEEAHTEALSLIKRLDK